MKLSNYFSSDPQTANLLRSAGIHDTNKLIDTVDVLEDPGELASLLDIDEQTFADLVSRAELLALQGMGQVYVDLLAAAGINTKQQLSMCDPFELHAKIKQVAQHSSVGRVPNRATVEDWIEQAQM